MCLTGIIWLLLFLNGITADEDAELQAALQAHNIYRKMNGAKELRLNNEMSDEARHFAKEFGNSGNLKYKKKTSDGENLAYGCSSNDHFTLEDATNLWYKESCDRGAQIERLHPSPKAAHFMQLIYDGSKEIGMGSFIVERGDKKCTYIVARYRPSINGSRRVDDMAKRTELMRACDNLKKHRIHRVRKKENVATKAVLQNETYINETIDKATDKYVKSVLNSLNYCGDNNNDKDCDKDIDESKVKKIKSLFYHELGLAVKAKIGKRKRINGEERKIEGSENFDLNDEYKNNSGEVNSTNMFFIHLENPHPSDAEEVNTNRTRNDVNSNFLSTSNMTGIGDNESFVQDGDNATTVISFYNKTVKRNGQYEENIGEVIGESNLNQEIMSEGSGTEGAFGTNGANVSTSNERIHETDVNANQSIADAPVHGEDIDVNVTEKDGENSNKTAPFSEERVSNSTALNDEKDANLTTSDELGSGSYGVASFSNDREVDDRSIDKLSDTDFMYKTNVSKSIGGAGEGGEDINIGAMCSSVKKCDENTNFLIKELCCKGKGRNEDAENGINRMVSKDLAQMNANSTMEAEQLGSFFSPFEKAISEATGNFAKIASLAYIAGAKAGLEEGLRLVSQDTLVGDNCVEFGKAGAAAHNELRKTHGAPNLTLDRELEAGAQEYAEYLAKHGEIKHAENLYNTGENLAYGCFMEPNKVLPLAEAIKSWYEEGCDPGYDFSKEKGNRKTGRFTQVVWANSKRLGMGRAVGKKGDKYCTFIVARYHPAGNSIGKYKENVFKGSVNPDKRCLELDGRLREFTTCPYRGRIYDSRPFVKTQFQRSLPPNKTINNTKDRTSISSDSDAEFVSPMASSSTNPNDVYITSQPCELPLCNARPPIPKEDSASALLSLLPPPTPMAQLGIKTKGFIMTPLSRLCANVFGKAFITCTRKSIGYKKNLVLRRRWRKGRRRKE